MKTTEFVWLNDELIPLEQARVSVNDRGFQYGDGWFETVRAEAGNLYFLTEHLARLEASAAAQPTLVMWARPYEPPPPAEYAAGWPAVIFPERRTTMIGRHKSLNYLFYLAARQYALDCGAREAIILEADGLVSEGAATSLVYLSKGRYCTPAAASALPGVTVAALSRALAREGLSLATIPTTSAPLLQADGVWLANSMMGLMPVAAIDGQTIPISEKSVFLQEILWAEARRAE